MPSSFGRARRHLRDHPFPDDDFRWILTEPVAVPDGWYFRYEFERTAGEGQLPPFAGAIGFIVERTGSVSDVAYSQWSTLFGDDASN